MSRIEDVSINPQIVYVGNKLTIRVKAESKITWQELKTNFTWNTLKNYKFRDIGGNK